MTVTSISEAPAGERYLDAARDCILDLGWRRTTLTEIARRAGVSRMTIYRTWADMPALLGDLLTREWTEMVTSGQASYDGQAPTPEVLATVLVHAVGAVRDNELFVRIVDLDPELLLPYLLNRRGRSQQLVLDLLIVAVTEGQAAGTIRDGDPAAIARGLLLMLHGFVMSAQTMVDDDVDEAAIEAELRTMTVGVLAR